MLSSFTKYNLCLARLFRHKKNGRLTIHKTVPHKSTVDRIFNLHTKLLRSIVNAKVLNKEELNLFYEGNNTIINDLSYDLVKLNNKKINVKEFLKGNQEFIVSKLSKNFKLNFNR